VVSSVGLKVVFLVVRRVQVVDMASDLQCCVGRPVQVSQVRRLAQQALPLAAYAVCLTLAVLVVGTGVDRLAHAVLQPLAGQTSQPKLTPVVAATAEVIRTARLIPTNDEWNDKIRDPAFWAKLRGNTAKPSSWSKPDAYQRSNLGVIDQLVQPVSPGPSRRAKAGSTSGFSSDGDDTYRTVCVRLCDGSFTPLSFATTRENFDTDAARCANSCGGQARMFFYKNPGSDLADMEDQTGQPYRRLPNASLYKTKYVEGCKCRPHPWEDAALDQHKVYALEAQSAKGSKTAAADLKDLRAKLQQTEASATAERMRSAQAKVVEQKRLADEARAAKAAARTTAAAERSAAKSTVAADQRIALATAPAIGQLPFSAASSGSRITVLAPNGTPMASKARMSRPPVTATQSSPQSSQLKQNLAGVVTVVSDRALRSYVAINGRFISATGPLRAAHQSRPLYAQ
jgi:Protein of unknown function (DUF2865)